jgi:Putative beta barrel porin-7 (BBP7)
MGMIFLDVLAGVVALALASPANASVSDCRSIADPMKRLACYDRTANAAAPSGKSAAANHAQGAVPNVVPERPLVKALSPVNSGPRFWFEAEGGVYGFSKNLPVLAVTAPSGTGLTPIPTAPAFIGLISLSTVTNPLTTGAPADFGGGGSYRMGYWLDPGRTMAVEGSAFFVQGSSRFDLSQAPTTVKTSTFVNTTPDTFVGLFDDTTTTTLAGAIRDQLYGADANFRMKAPYFGSLPNFDIMVGVRYVALDEKLTASVNSSFSRTFQPALGLPPPVNFSNSLSGSDSFRIRNDFIGPQVGFNAEQHWGRFWVANENKLAMGAMIEQLSVSGSSVFSTTPTRTLSVAGIPLTVTAGGPPVTGIASGPVPFGLFAQGNRSKTVFAFVPSGTIKAGYDINEMLSLTLAYNYLYMSHVGRVGDQIASPADIRQSGLFAQGITAGVKAKF